MEIFRKKKKSCCCENYNNKAVKSPENNHKHGAKVKILGGGCAKCNALEEATVQALAELGLDTTIDHVKDYSKIASYGVMSTPALVYDGKVISYGKVLKVEEVKELLKRI